MRGRLLGSALVALSLSGCVDGAHINIEAGGSITIESGASDARIAALESQMADVLAELQRLRGGGASGGGSTDDVAPSPSAPSPAAAAISGLSQGLESEGVVASADFMSGAALAAAPDKNWVKLVEISSSSRCHLSPEASTDGTCKKPSDAQINAAIISLGATTFYAHCGSCSYAFVKPSGDSFTFSADATSSPPKWQTCSQTLEGGYGNAGWPHPSHLGIDCVNSGAGFIWGDTSGGAAPNGCYCHGPVGYHGGALYAMVPAAAAPTGVVVTAWQVWGSSVEGFANSNGRSASCASDPSVCVRLTLQYSADGTSWSDADEVSFRDEAGKTSGYRTVDGGQRARYWRVLVATSNGDLRVGRLKLYTAAAGSGEDTSGEVLQGAACKQTPTGQKAAAAFTGADVKPQASGFYCGGICYSSSSNYQPDDCYLGKDFGE